VAQVPSLLKNKSVSPICGAGINPGNPAD